MTEEHINQFLLVNADKFPTDKLPILRSRLETVSDDKMVLLSSAASKSPVVNLVLSLFVGALGVDRFYLDDIGLGVVKLLTFGGCGIWALIDLFTAMGRTKNYNFDRIMKILM